MNKNILFNDNETIVLPFKEYNTMCGLIRYKDKSINLNNVFYIKIYSDNCVGNFRYIIQFDGIGGVIENYDQHTWWSFDTEQERDKVYNYIMDTYFIDIEKEMSK